MNTTIKSGIVGSLAALMFAIASPAFAALTGFSASGNGTAADSAPAVWSAAGLGTPAAPFVFMVAPDSANGGRLNYTATAAASGTVNFFWQSFSSSEARGASYDAGFFIDGVDSALPVDYFGAIGGALDTDSFSVLAGQSFGFYLLSSIDSAIDPLGASFLAIGEYSFTARETNNVPEPGSIALLGLGLIGLATMRRRKAT